MSSDTNELETKLHKIYGFCNDDTCTASCKPAMRKGMKLIREYCIDKETEAYKKGYIQCGLDGIDEFNRLEGDI